MRKTIKSRLKENKYKKLLAGVEEKIGSNKSLLKKIHKGHKDAKLMRGKMIG